MSIRLTGRVAEISKEPLRYSSANKRIVNAGIINVKTTGSRLKKSLISALPARKKVEKKNQPVNRRNSVITIYAIGEEK